jgi:hypothetical protein
MRHKSDPEENKRAWPGFVKFLGLMLMVVLFFLLAQSMVRHHFFTGGSMNYYNKPTGP